MSRPSTSRTPGVADVATRHAVTPPAVVRGWMYDSTEHWWALLVGAPPLPG